MPGTRIVARCTKTALDLGILALAWVLAYVIRFEGAVTAAHLEAMIVFLPIVMGLQYVGLLVCQVPRRTWRYVSLPEATSICLALGAAGALLMLWVCYDQAGLLYGDLLPDVPRGVVVINLFLSIGGLLAVRVGTRLWSERSEAGPLPAGSADKVPTLLIGAGRVGAAVANEIARTRRIPIAPLGFLDDDPHKHGLLIHGVPVLGAVDDLVRFVERSGAKQILITESDPAAATIRRALNLCRQCSIPAKIIPGMRDLITGKLHLAGIRNVAIEDLLRREPVSLDIDAIAAAVNHRRILVTGAGGSIGSELCRTLCRFAPESLLLLDHTENSLFHIHRELSRNYEKVALIPCAADVCDRARMQQLLTWFQPDMVLHAAAHKHVPLMECNPREAIKNNVLGTRNIADVAHACHVGEFVMISTDKAVNPSSVMGVSKRIAEMYVQAMSQRSETRFVTVRFGNVLGSAGSVIPIFQEQIARGGPVTVTHPDMERYFMTIPEACQLVLQAATMGRGGEIFILEMGKPVRIMDLARDMIRLSGLGPRDIEIQFTGIRPGEKLTEELCLMDEIAGKTPHPKILIGHHRPCEWEQINRQVEELRTVMDCAEVEQILHKLKEVVPEYTPPLPERPEVVRTDEAHEPEGPKGVLWPTPPPESAAPLAPALNPNA